jgi:hypothetical protein
MAYAFDPEIAAAIPLLPNGDPTDYIGTRNMQKGFLGVMSREVVPPVIGEPV